MKLNYSFVLLAVAATAMALLAAVFAPTPSLRYVALAGAAIVVLLTIIVYRKTIRPVHILTGGIDLLREQDFASRIRRVGNRDADAIVDMFNDMMDRLKRERLHVREQNEFLDLLVNASPMAVIILDDNDCITSANEAAATMLSVPVGELSGRCLADIPSQLAAESAALPMGSATVVRVLGAHEVFRCSRLGFMDSGWTHPFILIERLTDEVRAAEKQAYTKVIRMMAHEVNNSMGAIASTLDTVSAVLGDSPYAAELLPPLKACRERAGVMTGFIRSFAEVVRVPEPVVQLTDYQEVIGASLPVLEALCAKSGATLSIDLERAAPLRLDVMLMQQAVVNIVKNAAESAGEGGHVSICADGRTLVITDNGPGIAPEISGRLFSDIFTTKPEGQGLGLMLVAEILGRMSARFSLLTSADDGLTRFSISFA